MNYLKTLIFVIGYALLYVFLLDFEVLVVVMLAQILFAVISLESDKRELRK